MKNDIHKELIEVIKLHTTEGENPVDLLTSIIPLSKEAAYRRLRGEINFTLAEVVRISEKLGISLDRIAGIDKKGQHMFHINHFFGDDPFERYYNLLNMSLNVYKQVKKDDTARSYYAGNVLPPAFYFKYKAICKYVFFKWLYIHSDNQGIAKRLQDITIPQKVINIQQEIYREARQVDNYFIWGEDLILPLINDLKYFAVIDMVTEEEIAIIKNEILLLLSDLENTTKNACFPETGKKAVTYISNAYFDATYGYVHSNQFEISTIYLYGINQLNCIDPVICKIQKSWIESLISYSTLISGSGKLSGISFFSQQKALLHEF